MHGAPFVCEMPDVVGVDFRLFISPAVLAQATRSSFTTFHAQTR